MNREISIKRNTSIDMATARIIYNVVAHHYGCTVEEFACRINATRRVNLWPRYMLAGFLYRKTSLSLQEIMSEFIPRYTNHASLLHAVRCFCDFRIVDKAFRSHAEAIETEINESLRELNEHIDQINAIEEEALSGSLSMIYILSDVQEKYLVKLQGEISREPGNPCLNLSVIERALQGTRAMKKITGPAVAKTPTSYEEKREDIILVLDSMTGLIY